MPSEYIPLCIRPESLDKKIQGNSVMFIFASEPPLAILLNLMGNIAQHTALFLPSKQWKPECEKPVDLHHLTLFFDHTSIKVTTQEFAMHFLKLPKMHSMSMAYA